MGVMFAAPIAGTILPRVASTWEAQKYLFVTNSAAARLLLRIPAADPRHHADFFRRRAHRMGRRCARRGLRGVPAARRSGLMIATFSDEVGRLL
jgi:hypothetical protein